MINLSLNKQLDILLPNSNKALAEVLKSASTQELAALSKGKDLGSILDSLLKQSANNSAQDKTLLSLLKNNPTLQALGSVTTTLKDLTQLLQQDKNPLPLEKVLKNFLGDIQNISEKELKTKLENSGVFLESKISSQTGTPQLKEMFSNDLKAVLLKTQEELLNSLHPNKQELLKQIEKLSLQIDYYQLSSHLQNGSSIYLPYSWDTLKDGNLTIKSAKDEKFFCDIELNLKEHGALKLRLGLFEKNQLSINITTESQSFKKQIQEHLAELKKELIAVGITPREIRFLDEEKASTPYEESSQNLAMGFEVKA